MRLNTVIGMIAQATAGRLERLALRLSPSPETEVRPRDGVRYLWLCIITDVLTERNHNHIKDN